MILLHFLAPKFLEFFPFFGLKISKKTGILVTSKLRAVRCSQTPQQPIDQPPPRRLIYRLLTPPLLFRTSFVLFSYFFLGGRVTPILGYKYNICWGFVVRNFVSRTVLNFRVPKSGALFWYFFSKKKKKSRKKVSAEK